MNNNKNPQVFLAIDPGSGKCGLAIIDRNKNILHKEIVATEEIERSIAELVEEFKPDMILMGNATWSDKLRPIVKKSSGAIPLKLVDEKHSSERARLRYFKENPPRGLWKLIPVTLQVPKELYDDYAAIILAEDYIDRVQTTEAGSRRQEAGKRIMEGG